jgi:hypothetical protein
MVILRKSGENLKLEAFKKQRFLGMFISAFNFNKLKGVRKIRHIYIWLK